MISKFVSRSWGRWNCGEAGLQSILSSAVLFSFRKRRFLLPIDHVSKGSRFAFSYAELRFPCAGSRLGWRSCEGWNRRKVAELLTASSDRMCGYGYHRSKEINNLCRLFVGNCAVSFGFGGGGPAWTVVPPLEKSQGLSLGPPPLLSINWGRFLRGSKDYRGLLGGFFDRFRKRGAGG